MDAYLDRIAKRIERTRKGRVWDVWIGGRVVHVAVTSSQAAAMPAARRRRQLFEFFTLSATVLTYDLTM